MEKSDSLRLDNQICFPLYACAKEVVRQHRASLAKLGLTYTQYLVMLVFWEHGAMTEKELGEIVHLDSGTLAPLLKRLEGQGLVDRQRLTTNERRLYITLTDEGKALRHQAQHVPAAIRERIGLTDDETAMLKDLLDKAMTSMEA